MAPASGVRAVRYRCAVMEQKWAQIVLRDEFVIQMVAVVLCTSGVGGGRRLLQAAPEAREEAPI
jgi:hypothetical protein